MERIENWFLALGASYLVIGMGLGLHMGAAHDFTYAPVHAHINLVGGVLHMFFGVAYKLWPALKAHRWLARIHSVLFIAATPFLAFGIYLTIKAQIEGLVIAASLVVFVAMLTFCINAWRSLRAV